MPHHPLLNEGHQKSNCVYCKKSLAELTWESVWHGEFHYKMIQCECGKENFIRMNFHGSGHDRWDGREIEDAPGHPTLAGKINEIIKFKDIKRVDSLSK
jgi:hypothetical protein